MPILHLIIQMQVIHVISDTVANFFAYGGITESFPFIQHNGALLNFPILMISSAALFPPVRDIAKKTKAGYLMKGLLISVIVISASAVLWSPFLLERYRMDVYFLMGIHCFLTIGFWNEESQKSRLFSSVIYGLSALTIVSSFLHYILEIGEYYPEIVLRYADGFGF